MARDGGGSVITLALFGGVAYYLYSSGMLSSIFGTAATTVPSTTTATVPGSGAGTNPVPPPVVEAPPPPPVCSGAGVLDSWLAKVKRAQGTNGANFGPGLPGTLSIDEWGYYGNDMCTGIASQYKLTADDLFPGAADRGGPLNWSAFSGYAKQAGLSGPRRISGSGAGVMARRRRVA